MQKVVISCVVICIFNQINSSMRAEVITIGDEILIGQILDTNSKWIASGLTNIGISVYQITSIQDNKDHIIKAINEAKDNADLIILTGGLGPTKDDVTKQTLANYYNDKLILNKQVYNHIQQMFTKMNYPFTQLNKNQAMVPSKCIPFVNEYGTAPGMWFHFNNKVIISLPGVPNEMKGLMNDCVLPKLKEEFNLPVIVHKTISTYGMGESMVAERIENWENNLPEKISLAYLPSYGRVKLRLTAKGSDKAVLERLIEKEITKLFKIIGDIIVGFDENETIEKSIGQLFCKKKLLLATAESCTGGNIAKVLTSVPGSSSYFVGSIVAYNVAVKIKELNVDASVIDKHSVVSAEVSEAMAKNIQQKFKTNYAIATTGNAGPTTDLTDKKVGVVYIAIATPSRVFSKEFYFGKPREKVIERASVKALEMLRKEILKN